MVAPGMTIFTAPEKRYEGYIFDCDGTLAHSMPIHYLAWKKAVGEAGGQIPEDLFYSLGGVPSRQIVTLLNEKFGSQMDPEALATLKEEYYVDLLTEVTPIEEVVRFAREVALFSKVAVASGGTQPIIVQVLEHLKIRHLFGAVVTSEMVKHQKPAPDIFLEAARRISVAPKLCRAYEDTDLGIQAIRAAGMEAVDVRRMGE